ncbi:hypothetical protein RJ639_008450, partial [Escallonia herrerae]
EKLAPRKQKEVKNDYINGQLNLEGPNKTCQYCHAVVWYQERSVKSRKTKEPQFSICCGEGKLKLPLSRKAPDELKELLEYQCGEDSARFRESIRAYNSMFAFTSIGGKIDNFINDGKWSYCIASKNIFHRDVVCSEPTKKNTVSMRQFYAYRLQYRKNEGHMLLNGHKLLQQYIVAAYTCTIYTIEYQRRGFSHAHILIWLSEEDKCPTPADVDRIISAEIPDEKEDPTGYNAMKQFMMHGSCGDSRPHNSCMRDGECTKHHPKNFNSVTYVDENAFPVYKRCDDGRKIIGKDDIPLDNM